MRKWFFMLIAMFVVYLSLQYVFTLFNKENSASYVIGDNNFNVSEKAYFDGDTNFYDFVVKAENTFKFQVNHSFSRSMKVIKDIKYYKDDEYECILPIFKDDSVLVDIICHVDDQFTYYYNLKTKNVALDNFVLSLKEYHLSQFTEISQTEVVEGVTIYKNDLIKDHYVAIGNYRGIFNISKNFNLINYKISLYSHDVYNPKLSAFSDEYYVVVDYNKDYAFNEINVVNLVSLATSKIKANRPISMDSYIQGVVDGKIYLYDKDNKIQYEIMPYKNSLATYSGSDMKYYNNGNWETLNASDASNGVLFQYGEETSDYYDRFDKVGNNVGFYYMYKKNGKVYDVYRRSIQDEDSMMYLFSTDNISYISYVKDHVYYVDGNMVKVFNDAFGIRNVAQYKELEFNNNLKLYVYAK